MRDRNLTPSTKYCRFIQQPCCVADEEIVTWWLAFFLTQDARSQAERARVAMEGSLAQQKASLRRQAESAGVAMTPWTARAALATPPATFCEAISQPELVSMIEDT